MARSQIALLLVATVLFCCATEGLRLPKYHQSIASGLHQLHHHRVESSLRDDGALFPTLSSSVDSDTRPISGGGGSNSSNRERRQTGTVGGGSGASGGGSSGSAERRSQRVTSAPLLQSLSLLDLPVFSRGDRPSSMDKTLGAIFSKVAFSATNQSGPTGSSPVASSVGSGNKNADQADKVDDRNPAAEGATAFAGINSSNSTTTTITTSTTTEAPTTSTPTSNGGNSGSSLIPIRSKPVFEFDTRVFDFIPYDRTPAPTDNRQYNPNVPGLRGPSRINTARNPGNSNQPFNLRPTIPPLVDLSGANQRFSTRHHQTTTAATTTPSSSTTVSVAPAPSSIAVDSVEQEEEEDTTIIPAHVAPTISAAATTTSSTTMSTTSSTVSAESGVVRGGNHQQPAKDTNRATTGEQQESSSGGNRDAAWSIQVYGTSSLFALLGMFALSNLLRLRTSTRRLLSTSHCLSIQLLVLFLSITRSIHLLYDAYNHRRLLPPALAFSIFNVAFPCLSSALAVLLLGIFKATKLQ